MKKLILLLGAIILLCGQAIAQKDVRARDLDVERHTTFQSDVTFLDIIKMDDDTITGIGEDSSGTLWTSYKVLPSALAVAEYTEAYIDGLDYVYLDSLLLTPRATAPAVPILGLLYFDSTDSTLRVYNGIGWQSCY